MRRPTSKFPETDARSVNIDNSQATGPIIFELMLEDKDYGVGLTDPSEIIEALNPIFKSAFES